MAAITPFKVHIPDSELELLRKKLELARLPTNVGDAEWAEDNGVTCELMERTLQHWRTSYDWRAEEARINAMPQFTTEVKLDGFDPVTVHFVHARSSSSSSSSSEGGIPLLFLHGWPGSFIEVQGMLDRLLEADFHVVAPSLLGYGFSSYPRQRGLSAMDQADAMHQVMARLGYDEYVVQGGDWGSIVGRLVAIKYPEHVKALHLNLIWSPKAPSTDELAGLTATEKAGVERMRWFLQHETAYQRVHATKTRTFGFALHDSPVAMLAWMADKLFLWSDAPNKSAHQGGGGGGGGEGEWTSDELITWTLLHWFPGPTTAINMYRENMPDPNSAEAADEALGQLYVGVPTGVSHFHKEIAVLPRRFAEKENNIVWWREHDRGGHFAAYERPADLAKDVVDFFGAHWKGASKL